MPTPSLWLERRKVVEGTTEHKERMTAPGGSSHKQGTVMGVVFPCCANILGVLLFLRLPWIVGKAGIGYSVLLVAICCTTTFITTVSLSAIATNGKVLAGGSYFLISRSLGAHIGAAVGVCFYIGNSVAASIYVLGTVEAWETANPNLVIFPNGDINNLRVLGIIILIMSVICVAVGIKWVARAGTIFLFVVFAVIIFMYLGCFIGPSAMTPETIDFQLTNVPKMKLDPICPSTRRLNLDSPPDFPISLSTLEKARTPSVLTFSEERYFQRAEISEKYEEVPTADYIHSDKNIGAIEIKSARKNPGEKAVSVRTLSETNECAAEIVERLSETDMDTEKYSDEFEEKCDTSFNVSKHFTGPRVDNFVSNFGPGYNQIQTAFPDATENSFIPLMALWFPACTGIMAGSNRSGDLKYPEKSIPRGTMIAQMLTTVIYISFCVVFGSSSSREMLLNDRFFASTAAFPHPKLVEYGVMASTVGASLQSLVSAPRILGAIASDNTVPFLKYFKVKKGGEPYKGLALSFMICASCISVGDINFVSPIITMFFLLCYLFVNMACFLMSVLSAPGWRPTFKFYHWSTALLGMIFCLTLMIAINYIYCLVSFLLAIALVWYVNVFSENKDWGDSIKNFKFQSAKKFLLDLIPYQHSKNWKPQLLTVVRLKPLRNGSHSVLLNPLTTEASITQDIFCRNEQTHSAATSSDVTGDMQTVITRPPKAVETTQKENGRQKEDSDTKISDQSLNGMESHTETVDLTETAEATQKIDGFKIEDTQILRLVSHLKHGKGLVIVAGTVKGDLDRLAYSYCMATMTTIKDWASTFQSYLSHSLGLIGFSKVICQNNTRGKESSREEVGEIQKDNFCDVKIYEHLLQSSGIGTFEPNCVVLSWPKDSGEAEAFVRVIRYANIFEKSIIVLKTTYATQEGRFFLSGDRTSYFPPRYPLPELGGPINAFLRRVKAGLKVLGRKDSSEVRPAVAELKVIDPKDAKEGNAELNGERQADNWAMNKAMKGTIDIWWIVMDGGLLLLLPFLLQKHVVWSNCAIRLFAVVSKDDAYAETENELKEYMRDHRLPIEVQVYVIENSDVLYTTTKDLPYRIAKRLSMSAETSDLPVFDPLKFVERETKRQWGEGCTSCGAEGKHEQSEDAAKISPLVPTWRKGLKSKGWQIVAERYVNRKLGEQDGQKEKEVESTCGETGGKNMVHRIISKIRTGSLQKNMQHFAAEASLFDESSNQEDLEALGGLQGAESVPEDVVHDNSDIAKTERNSTENSDDKSATNKFEVDETNKREGNNFGDENQTDEDMKYPTAFCVGENELCMPEILEAAKILNQAMKVYSKEAAMILTNLPDVPARHSADAYFQFVEAICQDLHTVLLVRGSATAVITPLT